MEDDDDNCGDKKRSKGEATSKCNVKLGSLMGMFRIGGKKKSRRSNFASMNHGEGSSRMVSGDLMSLDSDVESVAVSFTDETTEDLRNTFFD